MTDLTLKQIEDALSDEEWEYFRITDKTSIRNALAECRIENERLIVGIAIIIATFKMAGHEETCGKLCSHCETVKALKTLLAKPEHRGSRA